MLKEMIINLTESLFACLAVDVFSADVASEEYAGYWFHSTVRTSDTILRNEYDRFWFGLND
jgi:hypothetical protein